MAGAQQDKRPFQKEEDTVLFLWIKGNLTLIICQAHHSWQIIMVLLALNVEQAFYYQSKGPHALVVSFRNLGASFAERPVLPLSRGDGSRERPARWVPPCSAPGVGKGHLPA